MSGHGDHGTGALCAGPAGISDDPRLILHAPVYFRPGQSSGDSCHAHYQLPADGSDHLLPHACVGMCCLCGRRGVAVEPGFEDAYLTGKYSHIMLDGHKHKSVREVEDALRAVEAGGQP